jgi:arylsulfatase A-like enzyme
MYNNVLQFIDDRIGEIIDWLRREDQRKDTELIITGDATPLN